MCNAHTHAPVAINEATQRRMKQKRKMNNHTEHNERKESEREKHRKKAMHYVLMYSSISLCSGDITRKIALGRISFCTVEFYTIYKYIFHFLCVRSACACTSTFVVIVAVVVAFVAIVDVVQILLCQFYYCANVKLIN